MLNFTVVYEDPINGFTFRSMVFAVDANNFLIADECGHFRWVPMQDCRLVGYCKEERV